MPCSGKTIYNVEIRAIARKCIMTPVTFSQRIMIIISYGKSWFTRQFSYISVQYYRVLYRFPYVPIVINIISIMVFTLETAWKRHNNYKILRRRRNVGSSHWRASSLSEVRSLNNNKIGRAVLGSTKLQKSYRRVSRGSGRFYKFTSARKAVNGIRKEFLCGRKY